MSYRCAIGPGMERIGMLPCEAHIRCDGCGVTILARTRTGGPPAWLLNRKAPRGWKLIRQPDDTRVDYCPKCKPRRKPRRRSRTTVVLVNSERKTERG